MKGFSSTTAAIDVSIIKRIELMARANKGVISLAQGIPSFDTPQHIAEAAKKAIDTHLVDKYTAGFGIDSLREAIARKVGEENGIEVAKEEVIVTHGATEAFMAIFMALLDKNDEIIVPTPNYASHLTQITVATHGSKAVFVPLTETKTAWMLNSELLEKAITSRTKAILICNPSNPIGKVYTKEELKTVAKIALKHNLFIITDEIYEHFTFDGKKHVSIGSFPEVRDRTISVFGVSKSYAMTGWRIGYIIAKKQITDEIFKIHDTIITCPTAVSQYAALAAFVGPQSIISEFKKVFERRRAIVAKELAKTNKLTFILPQGAYYSFPKIVKPVDDVAFAIKLIKEAKVAVVPGSPFGKGGENHIRISFGCNDERLVEGLRRVVNFLQTKF